MSRVIRKTNFNLCENKGADQLSSNCTTDQRPCFRYTDSSIPLPHIPKFQASSLFLRLYRLVCVRYGRTIRKTGFLTSRVISYNIPYLFISPLPEDSQHIHCTHGWCKEAGDSLNVVEKFAKILYDRNPDY